LGGAISFYLIWQGRENFSEVVAFTHEYDWVGGLSKLNGMFDAFQRGGWRSGVSFVLIAALVLAYRRRRKWMWDKDPWILFAASLWSLTSTLQPQWTLSWLSYFPLYLLLFYSMGRLECDHPPEHDRVLKLVAKFGFLSAAVFSYTSSNVLIN